MPRPFIAAFQCRHSLPALALTATLFGCSEGPEAIVPALTPSGVGGGVSATVQGTSVGGTALAAGGSFATTADPAASSSSGTSAMTVGTAAAASSNTGGAAVTSAGGATVTSATATSATATSTTGAANVGGAGGSTSTTGLSTAGGAASTTTSTMTATTGSGTTGDILDPAFILGADISFVQEEEDKGSVFMDGGQPKDLVQILKDHGFNYARLRLFHAPGSPGGYQYEFVTRAEPYCDLAHTIEMAQRVKAAGMGLLLDFHYSDTWADPDDQHKPAAWEGLSFQQLVTEVHDYTRDTLLAMQSAGVLPDMVQVGNEITPGMLHPDGHTYDPDNWPQLAQLLTAGLSAVKEVNPNIQTMLHLDRGGDNETTRWWVDEALSRGVQFDILGQSAYAAFHGGPSVWEANFEDLSTRYPELKFVIAEYNGNKREANDIMRNLPNGRGLGTFFWEPTASGEWGSALFTWSGNEAHANSSDFAIYDQIADDYGLR